MAAVSKGSSKGVSGGSPGPHIPQTGCQHPPVLVPPQCCQASHQGHLPWGSPALRRVGDGAAAGQLESRPDGGGEQELCLLPLQPLPPFLGPRGHRSPLRPNHPAAALPAQRQPAAPHWLPCLPGGLLSKGWAQGGPREPTSVPCCPSGRLPGRQSLGSAGRISPAGWSHGRLASAFPKTVCWGQPRWPLVTHPGSEHVS